jgi:hypothetical protein
VSLLVPVVVAVILTLFAWPASRLGPHELPIGLAGPAQATEALAHRLAAAGDAFEIHRYADERAARAAIRNREVYGAVVVGPDGVALLTASAASPAVAQLLSAGIAEQMRAVEPGGQAPGDAGAPRTVDVVPTTSGDPRGLVLATSLLPLVVGGVLTGVAVGQVTRPGWGQVGGLLLTSVLVGLVAVGIAQAWLDALRGEWWLTAGAAAATAFAVASVVAGCSASLGRIGTALSVLVTVIVGNPLSGVSAAPELLPRWAGATGQLPPPGAGASLIRNVAFFDGAAVATPSLVLAAWTVAGLLLVGLGARRERRAAADPH